MGLAGKHLVLFGGALACSACFPQFGEYDGALEAGGGGAGGGAVPTGAGVAEGGGQGIHEIDCTNGLDDDADGSPDCEDQDCDQTTCVTVPDGWQGPVVLAHSGASCTGVYSRQVLELKDNVSGALADCPCSCGPPTGGICKNAEPFEVHSVPACQDPAPVQNGVTMTCANYAITGAESMLIHDSPSAGGSCLPLVPPVPAQVVFETRTICSTDTGGGCGRSTCTPLPDAENVEPFVCMHQSGDLDCPSGFPTKHLFFEDVADDRDCSAGCVCGAPRCPVTFDSHAASGCATPALVTYSSAMGCIENPQDITFGDFEIHQELAACGVAQDTNEPIGSVAGTNPRTVCCADR